MKDSAISPVSSLVQLKPQGQLLQVKTLFRLFKVVAFTYVRGFVWRHLMSLRVDVKDLMNQPEILHTGHD